MRAAITLLAASMLPAAAAAYDAAPPQSFIKPLPGGRSVLVMLQPEGRNLTDDVRKTFPKSGLYPADDPKAPLWTCDWTCDSEQNVTVSADGEWAVRVPDVEVGLRRWLMTTGVRKNWRRPAGWEGTPAAFVYHRGQLVRKLAVKDLFDPSRFSDEDCFMGPVVLLDPIDDGTGTVRLATAHEDGSRQTAVIDARTGEVTARDAGRGSGFEKCGTPPPGRWWRWVWVILIGSAVVGLGTAGVAVLALVLVRRKRV